MLFLNTNLIPAAALAYTALQACSKSRYGGWFRDYTSFLYVLVAFTQAITRQSKGEDNDYTHAFHNAVKAAQSKVVVFIEAQQKSDNPEQFTLSCIEDSKLKYVGGISDKMLDAMVDYANSDNTRGKEFESSCEWVRDLKRKRDEAKRVR